MSLRRITATGAPFGEDRTHESCFHTFPMLPRDQVMHMENMDLGRQLRAAASRGDLEVLQSLLSLSKVNPNSRSEAEHASALHFAAENHELEAVRMLLDDGRCNVDGRDYYIRTPCHAAAMVGDFEIIKLLANHSRALADLTLKDHHGKTCWDLAYEHGFYECGDETKELAFDGPGMRLQLWANSEEKRLLGIIQRHSILLGESPVPGEYDCEYIQPPIYGTDLDVELQTSGKNLSPDIMGSMGEGSPSDIINFESLQPDKTTEQQTRQLARELCCRVASRALQIELFISFSLDSTCDQFWSRTGCGCRCCSRYLQGCCRECKGIEFRSPGS
mmetsp:Transcript_29273/g.95734  ORF Transcript_29273/g.95734 Transcript_29273/m.95734 type:complete len:332 (-) Transcript_29273:193-1188(-)